MNVLDREEARQWGSVPYGAADRRTGGIVETGAVPTL